MKTQDTNTRMTFSERVERAKLAGRPLPHIWALCEELDDKAQAESATTPVPEYVDQASPSRPPDFPQDLRLITISGNGAGCGKSLLAKLLNAAIPGSKILEMDEFGNVPIGKLQGMVLDQMEESVVISVGNCCVMPHWDIKVTRYGFGEEARP